MANIAPWLSVRDAAEALTFYTAAFAAVELERLDDDAGQVVVAQLSIDGAAYGWRIGRVADPFGHHWEVGRRLTP